METGGLIGWPFGSSLLAPSESTTGLAIPRIYMLPATSFTSAIRAVGLVERLTGVVSAE